MQTPIDVVDAFTDRPYAGNPAAVCMLQQAADEAWMQRVAAEMNLSETAFLVPTAPTTWQLRWFTPRVEVDLCGHATLAAAHVLWHEQHLTHAMLQFDTRSGRLHAQRDGDWICLDFPADPPQRVEPTDALVAALGCTPDVVLRGHSDLLAILPDVDVVRGLAPDMRRLLQLDARGVIVSAQADGAPYDFVSRFFGPRVGIDEDPVTGSAHCLLGPYWGERLAKTTLLGFQASARGGTVGVQLQGERVQLRGRAVTTLRGTLHA